jgi:phosphatidylserine/phosphatidylglycerophosphate/cardiolipin synthase-like enzyme
MFAKTHLHSVQVRDKNNNWVPRQEPAIVDNLFNEQTFYPAFTKDILAAKREVIIYSPFVSKYRADTFNGILYKLKSSNVEVFIFTRPIQEQDVGLRKQAEAVLSHYEELGANIYYLQGSIHEKVAIIDREILWEGSLNILSQRTSREIMRRTADESLALQMVRYLGLSRMLAEGYRQKYEKLYRELMEGVGKRRLFSLKPNILGIVAVVAIWWILVTTSGMIPFRSAETILSMIRLFTNH